MASARWVVAYDVPNDTIRTRVARTLERHGSRVQGSVFECVLEPSDLKTLVGSLRELLAEEPGGDVRFYRACVNCLQESFGFGNLEAGAGDGQWILG